jgi:hypothetical protein
MSHRIWTLIAAAFVLLIMVGQTPAATIISDSFTRTGNLSGSAPDVDTTAGAHTWSVHQNSQSDITTDGSVMQVPGSGSPYAVLPFQLSDAPTGAVVTLQADLTISDPTDGNIYWVAMGFSSGGEANSGAPWALLSAGGGTVAFAGPGVTGDFGGTASGPGTSSAATLALTYDKASNVASFYVNGVFQGSTTYGSAPTITAVSISSDAPNGNATVDNFTVSYEVPEPASAAVLILGLASASLRRRRNA